MALTNKERDTVKEAADLIARECEAGERVILRGFGTFKQVTRAARTARNPATGESVDVPAKDVLHFKASK
jgi:nucleoid DNA-binding protein